MAAFDVEYTPEPRQVFRWKVSYVFFEAIIPFIFSRLKHLYTVFRDKSLGCR